MGVCAYVLGKNRVVHVRCSALRMCVQGGLARPPQRPTNLAFFFFFCADRRLQKVYSNHERALGLAVWSERQKGQGRGNKANHGLKTLDSGSSCFTGLVPSCARLKAQLPALL